jgi:hypothetical protein
MAILDSTAKNKIIDALDSTSYKQRGFDIKYGEGSIARIIFLSSPECQFVINSSNDAFTTIETPGVRSDAAESFDRADFESCLKAVREWVVRIADMQRDWILDEFGGVADRNPSLL